MWYLAHMRPERVVSMGGYVSIPVCIAAWLLRIPIELFELNVEPGKAIRFLAPLAHKITVCFPQTMEHLSGAEVGSYPLRFTTKNE